MDWLEFELDERSFCYILYTKKKGELSAKCYMSDDVKEIKSFEKTLLKEIIQILPTLSERKSKRRSFVVFSNRHGVFFGSDKSNVLKTIEFTYSIQSDFKIIKEFKLSDKLKRLFKYLFIKERDRAIKFNEDFHKIESMTDCEEDGDEDMILTRLGVLRRKDEKKISEDSFMQLDDPPITTPQNLSIGDIKSSSREVTMASNDNYNESYISFESIKHDLFEECRIIDKHEKTDQIIYRCVYFDMSPVVFFKSHIKQNDDRPLRYNEDYYHVGVDYNFGKFKPTFNLNKLI
jgi:hypothetical protein